MHRHKKPIKNMSPEERLRAIRQIIEDVDARCLTNLVDRSSEIMESELNRIYQLSKV